LKIQTKLWRSLLLVLLSLSSLDEATAQRSEAFCALRDPDREIKLLAPSYERYASLVRTVSKESRSKILSEVPFPIHFDELGQHTLYVVLGEEAEMMGYVHVRSESFSWGLVRIAWMMDADLNITGYRFQRCRSPHRVLLESDANATLILGKSIRELSSLLSPEGDRLRTEKIEIPAKAEGLMLVLLKSAIKTKVVTEVVWNQEIGAIKAAALSKRYFGVGAVALSTQAHYGDAEQSALEANGLGEPVGIDREGVMSWDAIDKDNGRVGEIFHTPWSAGDERAKLWWVLGEDGRILAVEDPFRELTPGSKALFDELVGRAFQGGDECSTASELAALEVSLLAY